MRTSLKIGDVTSLGDSDRTKGVMIGCWHFDKAIPRERADELARLLCRRKLAEIGHGSKYDRKEFKR